MARIFVNTQNTKYKAILNAKGSQFGLGPQSEISEADKVELQQKAYEIFFQSGDLRDLRRKFQIVIDSITDPKFFSDGALDVKKINEIIQNRIDVELTARGLSRSNLDTAGRILSFGGTGVAAQGLAVGGIAALAGSGLTGLLAVSGVFAPIAGILIGVGAIVRLIDAPRQAGREDNNAPWRMTRTDFPNIIGQATEGAFNKRSLERLYDDRSGKTFNVRNNEALTLLIRECLADILFSKPNPAEGKGITLPDHPSPGGIGSAPDWNEGNKQRLYNFFSFRRVDGDYGAENTYVNALLLLNQYTSLIDDILNLQDISLSRSPDIDEAEITIPIRIKLETATVPLFYAMAQTARQVIREKVLTFFDKDREYKTLLNFGNDRQYVAEAWRLAPKDTGSVQLKLLKPLDSDIQIETPAFISREIAKSVIDTVEFELAPLVDSTPYLRPFNMDARNYVNTKMSAGNTTLTSLGLATGSVGAVISGSTISYGDSVFRRWFTGDFKSSELNIDFTDYKNFVYFGSAYKRLEAFNQKLKNIEELTSASISSSVSSSIVSLMLKAREKEDIIRNFDPYEQFLYYGPTNIPYSSSAFYVAGDVEYNATGSWPKYADGTVYSPYSSVASTWLSTQLGIAQRYDDNNPNYLILNLPRHIQEDFESSEYLQLFAMMGHLMDNIKVYIDQFPNVYSTNIDPLKELSMDQVYEVAKSFGLNLPNVYALENLQTFNTQFTGESGSRSYVAETWKRFIHSLAWLAKTKGSRTSFNALLSTYGINSPVLQIKESTYPATGNYIQSDELTYGLRFTGSVENNIKVPFVSSSVTASTLQITFNPIAKRQSSIITADGWAIDLIPHPSSSKLEYGRIEIVSGSSRTRIASSSYFPLFSEDYTNLMLRSQSQDITVIQADGDQILFQESSSVNLSSLWNDTTYIYVGGTGSIDLATQFDGIVDEVRIWGEDISDTDFISQAYDPGSYYGNNYTSSYSSLYVHIPFSQPLPSITSSATNESPYQNVSIVSDLPTFGLTTSSYTRILRSIKQFTPVVGSTIYTNRKVVVAPPPVFDGQFIEANGTKVLSRYTSIKRIEEKLYNSGQNLVSFAVSPTDFVNQNIMRSMGVVDVNNLIGSPRYIKETEYSNIKEIQDAYIMYFNKTVLANDYIRFFKDLTQGPSEMADELAPARAKLVDGIVIESPILFRNKEKPEVKGLWADGTATKRFESYVSGTAYKGPTIGAYDFSQLVETVSLLPDTPGDTLPLETTLGVTEGIEFKSSTKIDKLPTFRRVGQYIGNNLVSASILDENSSYVTVESNAVDTRILSSSVTSSGYPRNPYYGTNTIVSEVNTVEPFYNIPPRSDLFEVGTTTYFHKDNGIYKYDIYTLYKTPYLTRLDTQVPSALNRLYAKITLLPTSSTVNYPIRRERTIPTATYVTTTTGSVGVITVDSIFSLFSVSGSAGLRVRLYKREVDRELDILRPFTTTPSINAGVLFDGVISDDLVFPYLLTQTDNGILYYRIQSTTGSNITSSIVLSYYAYEPVTFIPKGYLPRHYKFSRDNSTALKRRNYLGCRDVNVTFDNQSPVVITVSSANTIIVNSNTANNSAGTGTVTIPENTAGIQLGGGGTLDIS